MKFIGRLIRDCGELAKHGIGCVAIMSNDIKAYPEDSPESMARWAAELAFPFPYLYDETQAVARAYGAVCTPDFFGYNANFELQYRGRLDASRKETAPADTPAIRAIVVTVTDLPPVVALEPSVDDSAEGITTGDSAFDMSGLHHA